MLEFFYGAGAASLVILLASAYVSSGRDEPEHSIVASSDDGIVVVDVFGVRYSFSGGVRVVMNELGYVVEYKNVHHCPNLPFPSVTWHTCMTIPKDRFREVQLPHRVGVSK